MRVLYFCTSSVVGLFLVTTLSSCAVTSEPYRGRLIRAESKPIVTMTTPRLKLACDLTAKDFLQLMRVPQCEVAERSVYEEVQKRYYCKVAGDNSGCTVPCEGPVVAAQCRGGADMNRWMAFVDYLSKNRLPYNVVKFREEEIKTGRLIEEEWTTRQIQCPTASTQPLEGKPVSITLRDMGSGHELWRWDGITGGQGYAKVDVRDYIKFQHALEQLRSDLTRGEFVLTGENLRSVMPLAEAKACMEFVKPLL